MPATSSSTRESALPALTPSNRALVAAQSQWIFTDAELYRTPSILDGMTIEAEHTSRSKGVNFITQVGILLKLPQLTLCTASVYLHRFFMRYSMKDLPQRPGMHPYSIAATALFLATKVEENCRKMKELIVACCRIAQKKPSMVVDEQSKEFWRWRDTILHNEDLLLEALCFDLQLEQPYRLLYEFICYFKVHENKRLRNSAWAFLNDSTYTVLCVQFPARTIAAAALYAAARHCEVAFEDDFLNRPWWEQLDVDLNEMRRACNRMADIYEFVSVPVPGQQYVHLSTRDDEPTDKTRTFHHPKSESSMDISANNSMSPGEINRRKRERDSLSGSFSQHPISIPPNGAASGNQDPQPSPKRQRREGSEADTESSSFNQPQPSSSQPSFIQAASNLNLASNPSSQTSISNPSSQRQPEMNGHGHPTNASPPKSRIPQSARIPVNQPRQEHPLPPPPPVTVPPLPHQHPHPPRRGSYGNNPQPPNRPPPLRGPPSSTGSSVFHPPPPPPPSNPPNVDELQQRIDAIIQQGMPPENDRPHEPKGNYYYRPSSRDRDRDRDRDRERDVDRNRDREIDRYRDRDRDRDRDSGREKGRDHDRDHERDHHSRSRRHSSETSGSIAMSTSLSVPSLSGTLPHPHLPPPPSLIPPVPSSETRQDVEQDRQGKRDVYTNTTTSQEHVNKNTEPDDGGGSEEGEV
ncbi:protein BUR2 [[Emmonsia] crescens]|uniref:RNA polymerase II holoenzyme cyclin-like subunit n=1 Tax=[Emmonsia] crescens TaxID=73230 RepID=A0A2B7ZF42_9EURO|nr:protein BUR2 [Emmonsia crescens]